MLDNDCMLPEGRGVIEVATSSILCNVQYAMSTSDGIWVMDFAVMYIWAR